MLSIRASHRLALSLSCPATLLTLVIALITILNLCSLYTNLGGFSTTFLVRAASIYPYPQFSHQWFDKISEDHILKSDNVANELSIDLKNLSYSISYCPDRSASFKASLYSSFSLSLKNTGDTLRFNSSIFANALVVLPFPSRNA